MDISDVVVLNERNPWWRKKLFKLSKKGRFVHADTNVHIDARDLLAQMIRRRSTTRDCLIAQCEQFLLSDGYVLTTRKFRRDFLNVYHYLPAWLKLFAQKGWIVPARDW